MGRRRSQPPAVYGRLPTGCGSRMDYADPLNRSAAFHLSQQTLAPASSIPPWRALSRKERAYDVNPMCEATVPWKSRAVGPQVAHTLLVVWASPGGMIRPEYSVYPIYPVYPVNPCSVSPRAPSCRRDLSEKFVAWASRPLSRERPAPARARAGCPRESGRDAHATPEGLRFHFYVACPSFFLIVSVDRDRARICGSINC
jgi:hypothetical protein